MKRLFAILLCVLMLCTACQGLKEEAANKEFNLLDYEDAEISAIRTVLEENDFTVEETEGGGGMITKMLKISGTYQEQTLVGVLAFYAKDGEDCLAEMELFYRLPEGETSFVKNYFEDCMDRYGEPQGWDNMWSSDPEIDEAAMARDYLEHIEERAEETANMIWLQKHEGFEMEFARMAATYQPGTVSAREIYVKVVSGKLIEYDGVREQVQELEKNRKM